MTTNQSTGVPRNRRWLRGRRWLANVLIVLLLVGAVMQGMPLKMEAATNRVRWLADWAGIGHDEWNMFAPSPDHQNHRVTAEVMSSFEHVAATWSMPNWRKLSAAERFRTHRWSEYYDHVWMNYNQIHWPALARHALKNSKIPYSPDEDPPKQVKLLVESVTFQRPTGDRWPAPIPPEKFDDKWVLWIEQLHLNAAGSDASQQP